MLLLQGAGDASTEITDAQNPRRFTADSRRLVEPASGREPLDRSDGGSRLPAPGARLSRHAWRGSNRPGRRCSGSYDTGRAPATWPAMRPRRPGCHASRSRDAERAPGVLLVLTKDNAPAQTPWGPVDLPDRFARAEPALDTDAVRNFGFPAAFVVAETFEQARAAAALVRVRYVSLPGEYDLRAAAPRTATPSPPRGHDASCPYATRERTPYPISSPCRCCCCCSRAYHRPR